MRSRQRRTRVGVIERLESRMVLSSVFHFGAVGDSLTDEYRFYPPHRSHARNWLETMAQTRNIDFGSYTLAQRGLPRDQGYANNWAKENSRTADVVSSQLAGLAGQVSAGQVDYAVVGIGTNDFLFFLEDAASPGAPPPADFDGQLATVEANAIANFDTTVNTLLAASPTVKVIVETAPDVRQVPLISQYLGLPKVSQMADSVATAEASYNAHIRDVASASPRVALADIAAEAVSAGGGSTLQFGGITLQLTTTGDDYHDAVLGDKIHPGTVAQGIIADSIIHAANTLGAGIVPLTPREIVHRAKFVSHHPDLAR